MIQNVPVQFDVSVLTSNKLHCLNSSFILLWTFGRIINIFSKKLAKLRLFFRKTSKTIWLKISIVVTGALGVFWFLNRFKNSVTFFYFYFLHFLKKVYNFGLLSWNWFKIWNLLGLHKKNTSSLKYSIKWNFMVCSAFLLNIEKISQKTQLEKSNLEKRHCNSQGFSGQNWVKLFS